MHLKIGDWLTLTPGYLRPGEVVTVKAIPHAPLPSYYQTIQQPAPRPTSYLPGARVKFHHVDDVHGTRTWVETVIPLPVGYPRESYVTHGVLTYVLRDRDNAVRGCFASNLEPVK